MRQWDVQVEIYQLLIGYAPLNDKVEDRIYDHIPQGTEYPYINIGDDTSLEWDTDDSDGSENTLTIHVWSRERGRREAKQIMEDIYNVLHRAELVITGIDAVYCYYDFGETYLDPDGVTRHGVIRFRIVVEYRHEVT